MQPTAIRVGTAASSNCEAQVGDLLRLTFGYGTNSNNGNVLSQTIARASFSSTDAFTYDALNRLKTASGAGWSQTYAFDRYGNRAVLDPSTLPSTAQTPIVAADSEAAVEAVFPSNQWTGGTHDAAGNQFARYGASFTYDAENRVTSSTVGGVTTAYVYDGDGRRVKKGSTVFVYDAFGKLAAEYGGTNPTTGTQYLTADHLGSTRLVTDTTGVFQHCLDYFPFGEELLHGTGGRPDCYAPINDPAQKFTGKERDEETGLDYFGARYFSGAQGRFTSPDKPLVDQHPEDPQSWNLYSYVRNNPLVNIDPTGEDCIYTNNFSSDGTVTIERGNCSQKGGTFVDGTINVNSVTYNARSNELGYSYANDAAGTGGAGTLGLPSAPQGGLSPFGQRFYNEMSQRRDASNQFITTFMVSSGAVGATGGTLAYLSGTTSGSGLTTLGLRSGHGAFRLAMRGFTEADIALTKTGNVLQQADGAKVFIKEIGGGRFNVIVEGKHGVVTALKNISQKSLERLSTRYGWK